MTADEIGRASPRLRLSEWRTHIKYIENQYHPDVVSPPGDTLAETLEAIEMSQAELARRTGRPPKTINEIIQGKAAITPDTAIQLEHVLGIPASFWNERERRYQAFREQHERSLT